MNSLNTLKSVIVRQKDELQYLMTRPVQKRALYDSVSKMMDQTLIKIITGPRRAGKSTFALSLMKGKDFIYLNFDDQTLSEVRSHEDLDKVLDELYDKSVKHIFVDEIQNLSNLNYG